MFNRHCPFDNGHMPMSGGYWRTSGRKWGFRKRKSGPVLLNIFSVAAAGRDKACLVSTNTLSPRILPPWSVSYRPESDELLVNERNQRGRAMTLKLSRPLQHTFSAAA